VGPPGQVLGLVTHRHRPMAASRSRIAHRNPVHLDIPTQLGAVRLSVHPASASVSSARARRPVRPTEVCVTAIAAPAPTAAATPRMARPRHQRVVDSVKDSSMRAWICTAAPPGDDPSFNQPGIFARDCALLGCGEHRIREGLLCCSGFHPAARSSHRGARTPDMPASGIARAGRAWTPSRRRKPRVQPVLLRRNLVGGGYGFIVSGP